jgi:hypothetical protein
MDGEFLKADLATAANSFGTENVPVNRCLYSEKAATVGSNLTTRSRS